MQAAKVTKWFYVKEEFTGEVVFETQVQAEAEAFIAKKIATAKAAFEATGGTMFFEMVTAVTVH